jgi:hypothetical protein
MTKKEAMYLTDMRMWQPLPNEDEKIAAAMAGVTLPHHYLRSAVRLYNTFLWKTFIKEKTCDVESGILTIDFRNKRGGFTAMLRAAGISSKEWAERYYHSFIKGGLMHTVSEGTGKNTGKVEVKMTPSKLFEFPEQPWKTSKTQGQRMKEYRLRKIAALRARDAELEVLRTENARLKLLSGLTVSMTTAL